MNYKILPKLVNVIFPFLVKLSLPLSKNPESNKNNAGFTLEERNKFSLLLNEGFIDIFRYLHPKNIEYTWWSYRFNARKNNVGWRIDYFICSSSLIEKVNSFIIHKKILGSDHCPIELIIDF